MNKRFINVIILLVIFIITSCATRPPVRPRTFVDLMGVLPPESTVFFSINIHTSGDLFKDILKAAEIESKEIEKIMSKTHHLYAGVFLSPYMPASISIIAVGRYSKFFVNLPLSLSKEWYRVKSSESYWQHTQDSLQVAYPEKSIILISYDSIERMLKRLKNPRSYPFPGDIITELEKADILIFFPSLPTLMDSSQLKKLPIQRVWIIANRAEQNYEVITVFDLRDVEESRILEVLFRLIIIAWMRKADMDNLVERLRGMEITMAEQRVRISGLQFSNDELVEVLETLLLSK